MKLTILFDQPYWVGVLEDEHDGLLYAARHIFGAEPSDQQVYDFVLDEAVALMARMTVGVPIEESGEQRAGYKRRYKRMVREAKRETEARGISSQAQAAIKQQLEQNKQVRRKISREERDAARERKRQIARDKAREKHRGH